MPKKKKDNGQPRKVGRPRVNLEFHEARELVRNENISSVAQYKKWWMYNTPAKIPKRPDRAYKSDWQGWNDFLGSSNIFPSVRPNWRPFVEARSFVQQLGFRTKGEYFEYAKTSRKPSDIPSRPDLIYREDWFTWRDFIGADIASVKRNVDAAGAVFFIIRNAGRPNNVYQFGITMEGKETVIQAQVKHGFNIVSLFRCDIDFQWERYVQLHGKQYWDGGRNDEYVVYNINEFTFQINEFVEQIFR